MVIAARRAYSDAVAWMRSRVPPRRARGSIATNAVTGSVAGALVLLGTIGLVSPARFGSQGTRAFGSGWPAFAVAAIVGAGALWAFSQRRTVVWLVARAREPFRRPLSGDPAFDGAAAALRSCPAPLKTRFALAWIWGPSVAAVAATGACLSFAYFVIDAVLARGEVAWQHPVFAGLDLVIAGALFRIAAGRLAVWPLAVGVHRDATDSYP